MFSDWLLHLLFHKCCCNIPFDQSAGSSHRVTSYLFQILTCILDPLLQMCSLSASRLNPADMAAYMMNCLYAMQSTLALYEFTDQRLEMLQAQVRFL